MKRHARWLSGLILLLGTLGMPGVAAAAPPPPDEDVYTWMSCTGVPPTTGSFDGLAIYDDAAGQVWIQPSGTVTACHAPAQFDVYALAWYASSGTTGGFLHRYNQGGLSNYFMTESAGLPLPSSVTAVCLITDPATRLDCYAVATGPGGTHTIGAHIPVTDSRVTIWVTVDMTHEWGGEPSCPNCWP